ncbi:MAG: hypothetical protein IH918_08900 [Acidobacteria bacterium]|nr:hypothetical protein [Acidobacteriota bacterium]
MLMVIKTTWEAFQRLLGTKALNGDHWLSMAGLALVVRLVAEAEKGPSSSLEALDGEAAVIPRTSGIRS